MGQWPHFADGKAETLGGIGFWNKAELGLVFPCFWNMCLGQTVTPPPPPQMGMGSLTSLGAQSVGSEGPRRASEVLVRGLVGLGGVGPR